MQFMVMWNYGELCFLFANNVTCVVWEVIFTAAL